MTSIADLRKEIIEALIPRMNGVYDIEHVIRAAEQIAQYIEDGTVPPLPLSMPPTTPGTGIQGGSASTNTKPQTAQSPIRDYYKR